MHRLSLAAPLLLLWLSATGYAGEVSRRALVVGANDGGGDLGLLIHAEADAARVAGVLIELGGFEATDVVVLSSPDRATLLASLHDIRTAPEAEESLFIFYYSGHADGSGLRLGTDLLEWSRLKEGIREVPADVHLGVLDACRAGQITRVKGAAPCEAPTGAWKPG